MEGSTKIKKTKPFKEKSIIENYVFFILLDIICLFYFKAMLDLFVINMT